MNVVLSQFAEEDNDISFVWYELQIQDLGFKFIDEINHSFNLIAMFPSGYQIISNEIRRFVLKTFLSLFTTAFMRIKMKLR